jgi:hypothetical protein
MAKKKLEDEPKRKRYDSVCAYCHRRYESEELEDIPKMCCKMKLTVSDHKRLFSRYKDEL